MADQSPRRRRRRRAVTDYSGWCDDSEAFAMISKRGIRLGFTSVVSAPTRELAFIDTLVLRGSFVSANPAKKGDKV